MRERKYIHRESERERERGVGEEICTERERRGGGGIYTGGGGGEEEIYIERGWGGGIYTIPKAGTGNRPFCLKTCMIQ